MRIICSVAYCNRNFIKSYFNSASHMRTCRRLSVTHKTHSQFLVKCSRWQCAGVAAAVAANAATQTIRIEVAPKTHFVSCFHSNWLPIRYGIIRPFEMWNCLSSSSPTFIHRNPWKWWTDSHSHWLRVSRMSKTQFDLTHHLPSALVFHMRACLLSTFRWQMYGFAHSLLFITLVTVFIE